MAGNKVDERDDNPLWDTAFHTLDTTRYESRSLNDRFQENLKNEDLIYMDDCESANSNEMIICKVFYFFK